MDRLLSMRAFCKVAETGRFAQAATEMGLNSAVVSRLIADLEAHLNVRLLNRTTRSTKLTEAGRDYFIRCQHILDEIDEAEALASGQEGHPEGHLRMLVSFSEGLQFLSPYWMDFRRKYPDISLDVILSERPVDLVEEQFDIAIQPRPFVYSSDVVIRELMRARVVLCAAPEYLKRRGVPRTPDDLADHDCVSFTDGELRQTWGLSNGTGRVTVKPRCVLRSNNIEALFSSLRGGLGIGPAFEKLIAGDLASGKLVKVLTDYHLSEMDYFIVYPSRKYLAAKTRVMIAFLQEAFRGR